MPRQNHPSQSMIFLPSKIKCDFVGQPTILDVALSKGVTINHSCGGMGSCTTCVVHVKSGLENLSPRNEVESEFALARDFKPFERLSCQTTAEDGLVVFIPPESQ